MDNNIDCQFGQILRKYRKIRNMTQEKFSELCGIDYTYYGRIERGEHSISLRLCQQIADALSIHISALFEDLL